MRDNWRSTLHYLGCVGLGMGGGGMGGGGASFVFRVKVPGELIQVQGDWASDAYLQYLSIPLDQRIQVAGQVRDLLKVKLGRN